MKCSKHRVTLTAIWLGGSAPPNLPRKEAAPPSIPAFFKPGTHALPTLTLNQIIMITRIIMLKNSNNNATVLTSDSTRFETEVESCERRPQPKARLQALSF